MPTVALTTLGCKVNQYETQRIADDFVRLGFAVVPFDSPADVYVVNSCSVTSQAESKSRYALRRAARTSPGAVRVVTGCAAQLALSSGKDVEGADLVVPNPDKLETARRFCSAFPRLARAASVEPSVGPRPHRRTRAFLKVQDGCDVRCTFCSIPLSRPVMRSRNWKDVLAEARSLAAAGTPEIVLTGVLVGSYGPATGSGGPDLPGLVRLLAAESGVGRIRLSSIEAQQVTPELIALVGEGALVPHLHIPLQSGDDGTLADMGRRYTRAEFEKTVGGVYRAHPSASVTTDVMVGFPTEDLARHQSTVEVCRRSGFLRAHVFRFSPRPGTEAATLGDPVPEPEKARRSAEVSATVKETAAAHVARFVGRTLQVVVEGRAPGGGTAEGTAENGIVVRFVAPDSWRGSVRLVRIDSAHDWGAAGEVVSGRASLPMLR